MKDSEKSETIAEEITSIGQLLRGTREKKNLTYEDVFQVTRLRPSIVKALEDEAWEELPSPVFIRGFIKSYAHALGIDESEALALYDKHAPRVPSEPEPLMKTPKRAIPWGIIVILVIAAGILFFFFWKDKGPLAPPSTAEIERKAKSPTQAGALKEPEVAGKNIQNTVKPAEESVLPAHKPAEVETASVPEEPKGQDMVRAPEAESIETVDQSKNNENLVLKADVKERTWMRITVDDQAPKEYIFNPGSQPQWKAQKSFDIMIGNAAGVELEFNGDKLGPLGRRGKVVRLRLPKEKENNKEVL